MTEIGLSLEWDNASFGRWTSLMREVPNGVLEQHWTYGEAVRNHSAYLVRRGIVKQGDEPVALIQTFERPVRFLPLVWSKTLRGPLMVGGHGTNPALCRAVLELVGSRSAKLAGRFHAWTPEVMAASDSEGVLSGLGLRKVVTGYGSANLSLSPEPEALRRGLQGKWRNALVQAEGSGLKVETARGGKWLDWLATEHDRERRSRRFNAPTGAMIRTMSEVAPKECLLLLALEKREPVAGALFFRHGNSATYFVGVGSEAGRKLRAQNLLLWRAMLALRNEGVGNLDLGGIDTRDAAGIARFKLGTGAKPFMLSGTWL